MGLDPASRLFDTCAADNCDNKLLARGLCQKHYFRAYRSGGTDMPVTRRPRKTKKMVRIFVSVLEEQENALLKISRATGKPIYQLVRDALGEYLSSHIVK